MLTVYISVAVILGAFTLGAFCSKPFKSLTKKGSVAFEKVTGTYRDPAYYNVTCKCDGKTVGYRVRNIAEIPEPDRTTVKNAFMRDHMWLDRFLHDKDAPTE
jgi:hypothetical protein